LKLIMVIFLLKELLKMDDEKRRKMLSILRK
jgi:hypothetical protein